MSRSPKLYDGPIGPFLEPPVDRLLVTLALSKTRGIYQRYLVTGWESWDGSSIQGLGKTRNAWGYFTSRKGLIDRLVACGIYIKYHPQVQPRSIAPLQPREARLKKQLLKDQERYGNYLKTFEQTKSPGTQRMIRLGHISPKTVLTRISFSLTPEQEV